MELKQKLIDKIPLYFAKSKENLAVVIIYHGFLSSSMRQEERTGIISSFYNAGFSVLAVDAVKHGQREDAAIFNEQEYYQKEREIFYIVEDSGLEIEKIIEFIDENLEGKKKKIYCAGISMGGLISAIAVSHERVEGAIIMASTLKFQKFAEERLAREGEKIEKKDSDFISSIEPLKNSKIYSKNLFLAYGECDEVVMPEISIEGYEEVKSKQSGKNVEIKRYSGGHTDNQEMIDDGIAWLKQLVCKG
ncbi:MAG: esterase [bacterium ADurb.Bin363]|nr:MAG: esterase [bacterium ADurb.Bin363]